MKISKSFRRTQDLFRIASLLGILIVAGGCATTGSFSAGQGERVLDEPPYFSGAGQAVQGRTVHLPISYQPGATQPALFDPAGEGDDAVANLLRQMNGYLSSLGLTQPVQAAPFTGSFPPDVRFGCDSDLLDECPSKSDDVAVLGAPWMKLSVERPSSTWPLALRQALDSADADYAIVITLEVGQYWPRQKNLLGEKEVLLGTGYATKLPWLTALDQPLQVLQLTGVLVDRDGTILRAGAEGLAARHTPVLAAGFGLQGLIREEDVQRLTSLRRDDLPGGPLVWQVAIGNLVAQLSGFAAPVAPAI